MKRNDEEMDALLDRLESFLNEHETEKDNESRGKWHDSHSEKLDRFADVMKELNGEDFDVYKKSYDEYHNDFSDLDETTYIDRLVESLDGQLEKLKEALHTDTVEIESNEEGTVVKTDTEENQQEEIDSVKDEKELAESETETAPETNETDTAEEGVDGSSISPEEMAELEEISKNEKRHY